MPPPQPAAKLKFGEASSADREKDSGHVHIHAAQVGC